MKKLISIVKRTPPPQSMVSDILCIWGHAINQVKCAIVKQIHFHIKWKKKSINCLMLVQCSKLKQSNVDLERVLDLVIVHETVLIIITVLQMKVQACRDLITCPRHRLS